jgi:hypothetical protein
MPVPQNLPNPPRFYRCSLQVGDARIAQDNVIAERFVTPWQATLSTSIGLAMKARANVKTARLELDSARATYVAPSSTSTLGIRYRFSCLGEHMLNPC